MEDNILRQGDKIVDVSSIKEILDDNDIIDIKIRVQNRIIHIGTSAESNSRYGPTYNKSYYIEKKNYDDNQDFYKQLIMTNNDSEAFIVISVDDISASEINFSNNIEAFRLNNKFKISLKVICLKHLVKWFIIIFGILTPMSVYALCDQRLNDPTLVKFLPILLAFVLFAVLCFYNFKFVLSVKKQEKKYNIKFSVDRYNLICDLLVSKDWLIAVGRFALYKKEIIIITKANENNKKEVNKILVKTANKIYKLTIDQQSGINFLLKWILDDKNLKSSSNVK